MIRIKLLTEEPVAFNNGDGFGDDLIWIFKNPTESEVREAFVGNTSNVRVLILDSDYYIAPSFYFLHDQMARLLYDYTKTSYKMYDASFVINRDGMSICTGELSYHRDEIKAFNILKSFIPEMISVGLITSGTIIYESFEGKLDGITMDEILDGVLDEVNVNA